MCLSFLTYDAISETLPSADSTDSLITLVSASRSASPGRQSGEVLPRVAKAPFLRFLQARADAQADPDIESTDWRSLGYDSYGQWRKRLHYCTQRQER